MEIQAGGRKWVVDAHATNGIGAGDPCWEVSFRSSDDDRDRVEMRWIPKPEKLDAGVARRLFELAGERLWRDARDGVMYRIHLVDEGSPGDDAEPGRGRLMAQFRWGSAVGEVPYDLDHPLGLATHLELAELVDRARLRVRAASA